MYPRIPRQLSRTATNGGSPSSVLVPSGPSPEASSALSPFKRRSGFVLSELVCCLTSAVGSSLSSASNKEADFFSAAALSRPLTLSLLLCCAGAGFSLAAVPSLSSNNDVAAGFVTDLKVGLLPNKPSSSSSSSLSSANKLLSASFWGKEKVLKAKLAACDRGRNFLTFRGCVKFKRLSVRRLCYVSMQKARWRDIQAVSWQPGRGGSSGGWRSHHPKTYGSNFIHHNFVQFGKQHSLYTASLLSIVLSQQCCGKYRYTSSLFLWRNRYWDMNTKYNWNRPPPLTLLAGSAPATRPRFLIHSQATAACKHAFWVCRWLTFRFLDLGGGWSAFFLLLFKETNRSLGNDGIW